MIAVLAHLQWPTHDSLRQPKQIDQLSVTTEALLPLRTHGLLLPRQQIGQMGMTIAEMIVVLVLLRWSIHDLLRQRPWQGKRVATGGIEMDNLVEMMTLVVLLPFRTLDLQLP
jgi:hypothetical protein